MSEIINPRTLEEGFDIRTVVRERYGSIAEKAIAGTESNCCPPDSQSSCCGSEEPDSTQLSMVARMYEDPDVDELPPEVTDISLGCGDPVTLASLTTGQIVLDLGSGGGIDCFLAAKKVGPSGKVIGVDMTASMLEKARVNKRKLGAENVEFRLGEIEHLPVGNGEVDVIISNCVINLSPDKPQVFREAFRVLKPGGLLAVSDIVTEGPLPEAIKADLRAWAGCIAGAMDIQDYVKVIEAAGFVDVEVTRSYWEEEVIKSMVDNLDPDQKAQVDELKEGGKAALVYCEGGEERVIEVMGGDLMDFDPQKAIFSAKIKARKL